MAIHAGTTQKVPASAEETGEKHGHTCGFRNGTMRHSEQLNAFNLR